LGFNYVKGLREVAGRAIVQERAAAPFRTVDDLQKRVGELRKVEIRSLAKVGALNFLNSEEAGQQTSHRRAALWEAEKASRSSGTLYRELIEPENGAPLAPMTLSERVNADISGTGVTVGRHPMSYYRAQMDQLGVIRAADLAAIRDGEWVRTAGWVIVRQRPGTAKGFMFISLEDETGVSNAIVTPDMFDRNRMVIVENPMLIIEGVLQNQDGVISVKARRISSVFLATSAEVSHDFH
jgi:error-prone DNA polymerase